ncbi:MAG: pyruvate ferredoxin oxidoreductase [Candidatus Helarchaeales archaeon]
MSVIPMHEFFEEIKEEKTLTMTGNYAVAGAVTQTEPDVICAFPITPQTQSVEGLSDVVNHGRLKAAFVNVESELAAISYITAAVIAGARGFTATASQGYLLMHEGLPMAVGWRAPIYMLISNRAWNAPNLSIWNSWEVTLADHGWNKLFSENVQETYDQAILSCMIAEKTLFPTCFCHDGFIISHSAQKFKVLPDEVVRKLTPRRPRHKVALDNPGCWGGVVTPDYFMEQRRALDLAKKEVPKQIDEMYDLFAKETGRKYSQLETFNLGKVKTAIITMGSMCGTIKQWMRKVPDIGLIKIRTYRPFPGDRLRKIIEDNGIEKLIVLEKNDAPGAPIPQVSSSILPVTYPLGTIVHSFVLGLGGRDVTVDELNAVKRRMEKINDMKGNLYDFIGVRKRKGVIEGE